MNVLQCSNNYEVTQSSASTIILIFSKVKCLSDSCFIPTFWGCIMVEYQTRLIYIPFGWFGLNGCIIQLLVKFNYDCILNISIIDVLKLTFPDRVAFNSWLPANSDTVAQISCEISKYFETFFFLQPFIYLYTDFI